MIVACISRQVVGRIGNKGYISVGVEVMIYMADEIYNLYKYNEVKLKI